ncbi:unnamed protein product, partial [Prorocentrum cordatum]
MARCADAAAHLDALKDMDATHCRAERGGARAPSALHRRGDAAHFHLRGPRCDGGCGACSGDGASAVKGIIMAGPPASPRTSKLDSFATRPELRVGARATLERWIQTFEESVEARVAAGMDSSGAVAGLLGSGPRKRPAAAKVILQVGESFLNNYKLPKLAKSARPKKDKPRLWGKKELLDNIEELSPPAGGIIFSGKWRGGIAAAKQCCSGTGLAERTLPREVANRCAGEIANVRGFTTNHVDLQWPWIKRWIRKRDGGMLPERANREKWSRPATSDGGVDLGDEFGGLAFDAALEKEKGDKVSTRFDASYSADLLRSDGSLQPRAQLNRRVMVDDMGLKARDIVAAFSRNARMGFDLNIR